MSKIGSDVLGKQNFLNTDFVYLKSDNEIEWNIDGRRRKFIVVRQLESLPKDAEFVKEASTKGHAEVLYSDGRNFYRVYLNRDVQKTVLLKEVKRRCQ
jgi:hypothetical protein